jgi:16S rRNA (cytosine967-C5)-methyltransferase
MSQDRQRPRNGGASNKRSGSGGGGWYRAPQGKPSQGAPRPRTGVHGSHLEHLDKVLARLLHFAAPADMVVSQYFREHHELGHRERGIIAEAAFAVLRRKVEFGQFAESGSGPARRRLVLLGLLQTAGRAAIAPFLNPAEAEWLDRWENRDRAALAPRVRANLPDWLFDALVAQHGADFTEALAQAWLAPAPLDLRVNTLKGERDAVLATLAEAGIEGAAAPLSPVGIRLAGKPALNKLDIFTNGTVEVQDEGSQLLWRSAPRCVRPGGCTPLTCRRSAWPTWGPAWRAAVCPTCIQAVSTANTTPRSSASPARSTVCWLTHRAAGWARCGAIPI